MFHCFSDGTILPLFDGPNVIVIEGGEAADFVSISIKFPQI